MIKTFEELEQKQASCASCLENKFNCKDGKRHVLFCGDTGCMSTNSAAVREKFEALVAEKGLNDKIEVHQVGCFGLCSQGPFIRIFPEDTLYRMVKVEDVEEIVEKAIAKGEIVERLLYVDPATNEKIVNQDDITFYKKQIRVALQSRKNQPRRHQ